MKLKIHKCVTKKWLHLWWFIILQTYLSTSSKYGGPSYHILRWHLVEHTLNILHVFSLCIHVNQITPHKEDIWFQTILKDLLMNIYAFFKGNYIGTCIQDPTKVIEFGHTSSNYIC